MKCTCPSSIIGFLLLLSSVANAVEYVKLNEINPEDTYVLIPVDKMYKPLLGHALKSQDHKPVRGDLDPEAAHDVGKDNSFRWKFPKGIPFVGQQTLKFAAQAGVLLSVESSQYLGVEKDSYRTDLPDTDRGKLVISRPVGIVKDQYTIGLTFRGGMVQEDWKTNGKDVAPSQWRMVKTTKKT